MVPRLVFFTHDNGISTILRVIDHMHYSRYQSCVPNLRVEPTHGSLLLSAPALFGLLGIWFTQEVTPALGPWWAGMGYFNHP